MGMQLVSEDKEPGTLPEHRGAWQTLHVEPGSHFSSIEWQPPVAPSSAEINWRVSWGKLDLQVPQVHMR